MEKKKMAGVKATAYIKNNMILGLGTGSTAFYMIQKVGELVREGLNIRAVATSKNTERLAKEFNIPLLEIDEVDKIDLVIDGVDEIDDSFNAIKGGGGALFREKIIAGLAIETIWILDESKLVDSIGAFPLPVEILPYGYTHTIKRMEQLSLKPKLREQESKPYITDNGNYIVDLQMGKPLDIDDMVKKLSIPGVLETGLFINMCDRMIVGTENGITVIENNRSKTKSC